MPSYLTILLCPTEIEAQTASVYMFATLRATGVHTELITVSKVLIASLQTADNVVITSNQKRCIFN